MRPTIVEEQPCTVRGTTTPEIPSMPSSIRPSVLRRLLVALVAILPLPLLGACKSEAHRIRDRIAGEYENTVDQLLRGEEHREHHVLRLTDKGYWVRTGETQLGIKPKKVSRDSGQFLVQSDTILILRSQIDGAKPLAMRYSISGDTIRGYNFARLGMDKESPFVRKKPAGKPAP